MEKYIPLDALVAEILKRREINKKNKLNLAAAFEDNYLLSFIDTLEVIEIGVDVGFPEGDKSSKTVQVIDANGNILIFNKAQKGDK